MFYWNLKELKIKNVINKIFIKINPIKRTSEKTFDKTK